jgi:hypothetical protein
MIIDSYHHFGGRHSESAALKNLLAHAGVNNPVTGEPFSEALCFGIAGGIGAGYSFCPSVPRYGGGSGISVVGRYKSYATDATWYQGFFDRIGARTRITETGGKGKAYQNLVEELRAGRPTVVWCSRARLPFLGEPQDSCNLWMHSFVVYGIDEAAGVAYGADRAPTRVALSLDALAEARAGICSHKNRTLTFDPPAELTPAALQSAVLAGLRACVQELLQPKIKTYSLPGLELWAKMICNDSNKDGWRKVFDNGLLYCALRDVFDSIETAGTGGSLYRSLFADFLNEAAAITGNPALADLAALYLDLGSRWTELAETALPEDIEPFRQTRELLREKRRLFEEQGEPAASDLAEVVEMLNNLESQMRASFPLASEPSTRLLEELRGRIIALHQSESQAALRLRDAIT